MGAAGRRGGYRACAGVFFPRAYSISFQSRQGARGEAGFRSVHVKVGSDVPGRDDLMKEIKDIFRTSGIQGSLNSGGAAEGAMTWELFPDARMKGEGYDLSVGLGKATVREEVLAVFLTLFKRCGNWFSIEKGNLPCLLCVLVTNPLSSCGELCWMWGVIICLLP